MSLRKSLDRVFAGVEGVYDMRTTDREKIVEFVKGDFKRFNTGGSVADRYGSYGEYGTSAEFRANTRDFSGASAQDIAGFGNYQDYAQSQLAATKNYGSYGEYAMANPIEPREITNYANIDRRTASNIGYTGMLSPEFEENSFFSSVRKRLSAAHDWITESGLYRGLKSAKNWVNSKPALKRFLDNLRESSARKRQEQPFGTKKDYQRLSLSGMGYNPGTFGSKQIPDVVKQLAGAFDPRINPKLVQFMMANRGTSDVLAKVMGTYKDVIKVTKRPRNVIKVDTPTFKLPPR